MSKKQLNILISPVFVFALGLLLLNDFVLKYTFNNWFTGKLSDFAGLIVFVLFWTAFFPRFKAHIHILTALLFVIWKSVYSEPLIHYWNELPFFSVARVVDYTDLIALVVLPLAYSYNPTVYLIAPNRIAIYLILGISVFAFTATSAVRHQISYGQKYYFNESREELFERINRQQLLGYEVGRPPTCCPDAPIIVPQTIPIRGFCGKYGADANISFNKEGDLSVITLKEINYECPKGESDKRELQQIFERDFISKLR